MTIQESTTQELAVRDIDEAIIVLMGSGITLPKMHDIVNVLALKRMLLKTNGNHSESARRLGISRTTLDRYIAQFDINVDDYRRKGGVSREPK